MDELLRLHAQMHVALDELEQLTQAPCCDVERVSAVRYRLTRLSSARRQQVVALCEDVLALGQDAGVAALREATLASRVLSSQHIGHWTLRRLLADWPGYGAASATIRAAMRREMVREEAVLGPHFR